MALTFISIEGVPNYIALSTDIVDNKIEGASIVGAKIFLYDIGSWKIVKSDLTLETYIFP